LDNFQQVESDSKTINVWLIHGTWARQARWTRDGSPLRKALQGGLKGDVRFAALPWTGRNNTLHRLEASIQLLASLEASKGDSNINFIVTHSHGGNIAADAIAADAVLAETNPKEEPYQFDGVVTLNTPFLVTIPRDGTLVLMHLILLGLCVFFLVPQLLRLSWFVETLIVFGLGAILVFPALVLFSGYLDSWLETPLTRLPKTRGWMLSIWTPDDEAFAWLEAVDSMLNAPYLVLHKAALPTTLLAVAFAHYILRWDFLNLDWLIPAARELQKGDFLSYLTTLAFEGPLALTGDQIHWLSAWYYEKAPLPILGLVLILSVIGYFLMFWSLFAIGALTATYLLRALVFGEGFGPLALSRAVGARLKVSLTPMFHSDVEHIIAHSRLSTWLRHSAIYDDPLVLEQIVKWMNERIELRGGRTEP